MGSLIVQRKQRQIRSLDPYQSHVAPCWPMSHFSIKLHGRSVRILRATCSQVLEFLPSVHYRNRLIVIYNRLKNPIEEI